MTSLDSRLAPRSDSTSTANLAGGHAWSQRAELELAQLVLTSFVQDQFYRGSGQTLERLRELVREADPRFVARLALFARREFRLRSVSHVLAAELAELVKGEQWTRRFYRDLVVRADDVTGILARRQATYGVHPLPNSLKRGLADALRLQDEYALAKYRSGSGAISMVDAVNLCRPLETPPLRALMTGTLAAPDTWEVALTRAGRAGASAAGAQLAKAAEWERLVIEDRLGYMALLRNLRTIAACCSPAAQAVVATRIADPQRVRRSRQLPFRFATALRELDADGAVAGASGLRAAVSEAMETAFESVPHLDGSTLVAVDTSGSMLGWWDTRRNPIETATLFAAAIAKRSAADVLLFDTRVQWYRVDPELAIAQIDEGIRALVTGGGTDFHLVFEHARARYDRIVILSDMQAWVPRPVWSSLPAGPAVPSEHVGVPGMSAEEAAEARADELDFAYDESLARHGDVLGRGFKNAVVPFDMAGAHLPGLSRLARPAAGWKPVDTVGQAYRDYRCRTGADPMVYCFDLAGYGTTQFPGRRVVQLAGFSEKIFELMPLIEQGDDALLDAIRAVEL